MISIRWRKIHCFFVAATCARKLSPMTDIQVNEPNRNIPQAQSASLIDLLDRILDKGLVIVGDIRINLLDIELLTIKIRLLVTSVDKAKQMGIDWWEHDAFLSTTAPTVATTRIESKIEKQGQ